MKLELKDFQERAVAELYRHARLARRDAADGYYEALILAAPTGSGKTVIANALFERILEGDEEHAGDPSATFLWLSDQPALNEQTYRKFEANSSPTVFGKSRLITIESEFDAPRFAPGHIYFLNTQKIGRDKKLVSAGDRTSTIWETIARTAQESPESFWVCIDEAHRGMRGDEDDPEVAGTITQKFILGSPGEIPAVRLILGISATPERFAAKLAGLTRTQRPHVISPEEVRSSGLIKDWITVYHPEQSQPSDYTLLQAAAAKLQEFDQAWDGFRTAEKEPISVEPLLVVQVDDAPTGSKAITKTDIEEALRAIETGLGRTLGEQEIGHALQEGSSLEFGDRVVQYVKPPDIQDMTGLRVVFFKMSLNTGWDCPRAEVMMSFRRAVDYTHIAQLVGRMVRNPLARRITTDDTLNAVALYLPYYDEEALGQVVSYLESPDADVGFPSRARRGEFTITVDRNTKLAKVFAFAAELPSYDVERVPKVSAVKRLVRLARFLSQDKIDAKAYDRERTWVVAQLKKELERVKNSKAFKSVLSDATKITVREHQVAYAAGAHAAVGAAGTGAVGANGTAQTTALVVAEQNLDDMYDVSGRQLGEGLHADYARSRVDGTDAVPLQEAKLELYALLSDPRTLEKVETVCAKRFTALHDKWRTKIGVVPEGRRHVYRRLLKIAKQPEAATLDLPERMLADKRDTRRDKHVFVDADGKYPCKLNSWEEDVLATALAQTGAVAWLRNVPRQDGSLSIPYRLHSEVRPMYPDFLVFRKKGTGFEVDILEPHASAFEDGWAKAVGLAEFAQQHGDTHFGRIELITKVGNELKRLDVNKPEIRQKVLGVQTNQHLKQLFEAS
jgi:type III restriction enzyme